MRLKAYLKYKESGLPWLGMIPANWKICRNGRLFSQRVVTGFPNLPILEVSLKTGVRVRDFEKSTRKQVMSDYGKYKRAMQGDIAYNMMRMWQGSIGVAPVNGLVSPAYVVARPFQQTNSNFFSFLFRTNAYMNEVNKYSHGIVSDRNRLYWDEFKQMPSVFPPLVEQEQIVRFLDYKCAQISRFIRNKRRLIELLKEQKQAIINQAVTRGLDPNVKLKPSGVPWLVDIPEHWQVHRLRTVAEMRTSNVDKVISDNEHLVDLCNYTDVYKNDVITSNMDFMKGSATEEEIIKFSLKADDVLITKDSETWQDIGVPAFVEQTLDGVICGYHLALLRPKAKMLTGRFLYILLNADVVANQLRVEANGVTRFGLTQGAIKDLMLPLPSIEEQKEISTYVLKQIQRIRTILSQADREIKLIQEYRTRLISDTVTGKIDVRDIQIKEAAIEDDLSDIKDYIEDSELSDEDSELVEVTDEDN